MVNFYDLRGIVESIRNGFHKGFKLCGITAVGGIPIELDGNFQRKWAGNDVSEDIFRCLLDKATGHSGMVTYLNPNNKSFKDIGVICNKYGHHWSDHWFTVSVVLVNYGREAELAFTRDGNIKMSWCEVGGVDCFVGNASIKNWQRFLFHRDSKDFKINAKTAMQDTYANLSFLLEHK